jgi:hypothetical protein
MVATLKNVGTADWDRERLNMSVNTPSSCSEEAVKDAVWAGNLARLNTFKCLTHVSHREGEPTVLGSG